MTKKTKKILFFIMINLVLVYNNKIIFADKKYDKPKTSFNVLVINSYHPGHYWESYVLDGLEKSFKENEEYSFNIKSEYLDFKNQSDKNYFKSVNYMLETKYKKGSIDAIYAVDDEAYEFIKGSILDEESQFYNIPFVFSGVNQEIGSGKIDDSLKVGLYGEDDTYELVNLILDLNPNVENLNIITEDSYYGKSINDEVVKFISKYSGKEIKLTYISSNYIEEVTEKLIKKGYTQNSVNILAGEFQYRDSNIYLDPNETVKIIKEYNDSPSYSNDNTYLNTGIVGGCVDLGKIHGELIGDILGEVLNGKDLSDNYPMIEPKAKLYVDYDSIYKYDINPMNVNSDVVLINKQFYEFLLPKNLKNATLLMIIMSILGTICLLHIHIKIKKIDLIEKQKQKLKEDRENLKTDFIVNLSHELRTPINNILNTCKVIKRKVNNEEINKISIEENLEVINNNSYRLLKISNNIIDITSAESGLFKIKLKNENIVSVVEEAFSSSISFAKLKNIDMIFDTDLEEIITAIDKVQIQRVVLNLLSNAIKYTPEEGEIYLGIRSINNTVEIKVIDTGIGIPKDKFEEVFYRFYQVDYSITRKNEGSGIGLCIAKDIVKIHNGKIELESKEGSGSVFKVTIPMKVVYLEEDDNKIIEYDVNTIASVEMADIIK